MKENAEEARRTLAPCGVVCAECPYFADKTCAGCREIGGRPFWLQYVGDPICNRYDCCVNRQGRRTCAGCGELPCRHYDLKDPNLTDAENEADLRRCLDNLKKYGAE